MSDTREKLSGLSVLLHWVLAIGMIGLVAFGLYLEDLPRSPEKSSLIALHKSLGVVILTLAAWRLLRRVRIGMPPHVGHYSSLERTLASITHVVLLVATLVLPISGMLYSIGSAYPIDLFGFPFIPKLLAAKHELLASTAKAVHAVAGKVVIAAVALHVAGALKHAVIDRDGTLKRMLGFRVTPVGPA